MRANRGPLYIFLAAVLWSFAGVASKFIPWGALSIACVRGVIGAVTIGLFNKQWVFKPTLAVWLAALGTMTTSVLFMLANKMTTAANAIVIQYIAPAIVVVMSALFTRTRPAKRELMMIALCLGGIALFFLGHLGHGALVGDLLALLSAFTFALMFFANRLPGANPMQASYLGCLLHVVLLPFVLSDTQVAGSGAEVWLVILLMGALQTGLAYVVFSKGIVHTSPVSASIIAMIEPILNPLWVFLLLGERPAALALAGAAIVISATAAYNVLLSRDAMRQREAESQAV